MHRRLEGHIAKRFDAELGALYITLLEIGSLVLDQVDLTLRSMLQEDLKAAQKVLLQVAEVAALADRVEDDAEGVLAKRGPVARDLRAVIAISKAVSDLRRAGDEAAKIAELSQHFYQADALAPTDTLLRDVDRMGRQVRLMLRIAVESFERLDGRDVARLAELHGESIEDFQSGLRRLVTFIMEDSRTVGHAIRIVLVMRSLERIGEYAHNLGNLITYLVSGNHCKPRDVAASES